MMDGEEATYNRLQFVFIHKSNHLFLQNRCLFVVLLQKKNYRNLKDVLQVEIHMHIYRMTK